MRRERHGPTVPALADALAALESSGAPIAPILYAAFTLSVVVCFPVAWLNFTCGALLGLGWGTLVANLAGVTSAAITRVLARSRLGGPVWRWIESRPRLRLIHRALEDGGWKLTFLIRLSPALPLGASHWVFAFVRLPLPVYLLVTSVATLPAQLMWAHFGVTGREGVELWAHPEDASPARLAVLALGGLATLASVIVLGQTTRRRLQAELDRSRPVDAPSKP